MYIIYNVKEAVINVKRIPKIVLSGGPGGGKSKALRYLKESLSDEGFTVYTIEESATSVLESGFSRSCTALEFQHKIALLQLMRENELDKVVADDEKSVIICDRGLMDCRVYLDDEDYEKIKSILCMTDVELRDRYDAVFHLNSTSTDEHLKYKTGDIRTENREEARSINERSLRAWCGNPHYRFIPTKETFDEKYELLLREVKAFLGIPKPLEIERKFLIEYPDLKLLSSLVCAKTEIEQIYLTKNDNRYRLRKRGYYGNYIYIRTEKKKISETVREEVETRLSEDEYYSQLMDGDVTGRIFKSRYCLMYDGVYYEIDIFPFWKKQAYLEVELLDENDEVKLPEFIKVIREVTGDSAYKNSSLCQKIPDEDV